MIGKILEQNQKVINKAKKLCSCSWLSWWDTVLNSDSGKQRGGLQLWTGRWGGGQRPRTTGFPTHGTLSAHSTLWVFSVPHSGTIPPIKSAQGEGDDVKKLFTIGCPVILVTLGVALLFVVRKKRKEKRLKRLRGEGLSYQLPGREGGDTVILATLQWTTEQPGQETRTWVPSKEDLPLRLS